jgi:hypothetical protein
MALIIIVAPLCVVWGASNGGNTIASQISSPGPYQVNSWVTGLVWMDYPEAVTCLVEADSWLIKNGSILGESYRGSYDERSGTVGISKYVDVYGSEMGVYWYGTAALPKCFTRNLAICRNHR